MEVFITLIIAVALAIILVGSIISIPRWWDVYKADKDFERDRERQRMELRRLEDQQRLELRKLEIERECQHEWVSSERKVYDGYNEAPPSSKKERLPVYIDFELKCKKCGDVEFRMDPCRRKK